MKSIVKIGLFATVLFFSNCKHNNESESEKESIFTATKPLKKDTSVTREYVCQIRAFQHIELRAYGQGYLDNIYVDEGQLVKKGQSMFQIMPLLYNLSKDPDKTYIYWENRVPQVLDFIDKINKHVDG